MRHTATAAAATAVLCVVLAACAVPNDDKTTPSPTGPAVSRADAPSATSPGDGPDPNTRLPAPTAVDPVAARVAADFATALYATPDPAAATAPYVTERFRAAFVAPAATAIDEPAPISAHVEAVHALAAVRTRWRFEVVVTVTQHTPGRTRGVALVVEVADTPLGPRVDGLR